MGNEIVGEDRGTGWNSVPRRLIDRWKSRRRVEMNERVDRRGVNRTNGDKRDGEWRESNALFPLWTWPLFLE